MTMVLEHCRKSSCLAARSPDRPAPAPAATRARKPLDSELARVLRARGLPPDGLPRCGVADEEMGSDAVAAVRNATLADEEVGSALPARETAEPDDRPHAGDATIVCDGSGGYRVSLGDWEGAPCGTEGCARKHEESHITDWKARWPKGCEGKDDGADVPTGGPGYAAFLKKSECDAHTVDLNCADELAKSATGDCKAKVEEYRKLTAKQRKKFC